MNTKLTTIFGEVYVSTFKACRVISVNCQPHPAGENSENSCLNTLLLPCCEIRVPSISQNICYQKQKLEMVMVERQKRVQNQSFKGTDSPTMFK